MLRPVILAAYNAVNALLTLFTALAFPSFKRECSICESFPEDDSFVCVENVLRLKIASDLSQIVRSPRIHFVLINWRTFNGCKLRHSTVPPSQARFPRETHNAHIVSKSIGDASKITCVFFCEPSTQCDIYFGQYALSVPLGGWGDLSLLLK